MHRGQLIGAMRQASVGLPVWSVVLVIAIACGALVLTGAAARLCMKASAGRCIFGFLLLFLLACSQSTWVEPVELLLEDADYIHYAQMHLKEVVLAEFTTVKAFTGFSERKRAKQIAIINLALQRGQWSVRWKPDDIVGDELVFVRFPRGVQALIPKSELPKRLATGYRIVEVNAWDQAGKTGARGVFKVYQDGIVIICKVEDDDPFFPIAALANYKIPRGRDIQC